MLPRKVRSGTEVPGPPQTKVGSPGGGSKGRSEKVCSETTNRVWYRIFVPRPSPTVTVDVSVGSLRSSVGGRHRRSKSLRPV